jgi:polyisoprenoid-binding protein YceI
MRFAAGLTAVVALIAAGSVAPGAAARTYRVDPTNSRATIHVGKAGAFSFIAGHTHEVSAPIQSGMVDVDLDDPSRSSVHLVIGTSAFKVSEAGEPRGDAPKVQEAMDGPKVLDVAQYPRIVYESTSVAVTSRSQNRLQLILTGRLTIRDMTQPLTIPIRVDLTATALSATGRFAIKQSAFGITPISVGGVVAVKDTLDIDFSIAARK